MSFLPSPIKKHVRFLHDALDMLLTFFKELACDCRDVLAWLQCVFRSPWCTRLQVSQSLVSRSPFLGLAITVKCSLLRDQSSSSYVLIKWCMYLPLVAIPSSLYRKSRLDVYMRGSARIGLGKFHRHVPLQICLLACNNATIWAMRGALDLTRSHKHRNAAWPRIHIHVRCLKQP